MAKKHLLKRVSRTRLAAHFPPIFLSLILCGSGMQSYIDVSSPYIARNFFGEPRLERQGLFSAELRAGGSTHHHAKKDLSIENHETLQLEEAIFTVTHNPAANIFFCANIPIYHPHKRQSLKPPLECRSVGPIALSCGITQNINSCESLDFIDWSVESGIILPCSKEFGNHGAGFPAKGTICLGIFDWLTIGLEGDLIFFGSPGSSLQKNIGGYLKADHFIRGFSALLGYSHSTQSFTYRIWDYPLKSWNMDTLHLAFSFDAATECLPALPEIEFFYERVLSGEHITKRSLVGFRIGTSF